MKLDAAGARSGIKEKIADPLKIDTIAAAKAIVEIAISKMSLAVREVSVAKGYDSARFCPCRLRRRRPAACAPDRARTTYPHRHRAALSIAFLGARHAARRRAARFHPHHLFADLASADFHKLTAVHDEMVAEAKRRCVTAPKRSIRFSSICAMSARSSRCRSRSSWATRQGRPQRHPHRFRSHVRAALCAPFAGRAVEMVNFRLGATGKRPKLAFPRLDEGRGGAGGRRARGLSLEAQRPLTAKIYRRQDLAADAQLAGPALIQEHGTTTVLYEHDQCRVVESGD